MAEVTSYTATRITELLSGLPALSGQQEAVAALVAELTQIIEANSFSVTEFFDQYLPNFQADMEANNNSIADLNTNTLPDLQLALSNAADAVNDLATVTIPSLQADLANSIENGLGRPYVYVQDEEPTNPDENDRDLVVGDTWFDSDNDNAQTVWNGVEWSTFGIDIPDFSLTIQKFMTSTHQVGAVGTSVSTETSFGTGVSPAPGRESSTTVDNFSFGPGGGDWVDRGAGAYAFSMATQVSGHGSHEEYFPSTLHYTVSGEYGTWLADNPNNYGLETYNKSIRVVSYNYSGGRLTVTLVSDVAYAGVCSLFFIQNDGENRVSQLSSRVNDGATVLQGTVTPAHGSTGGQFYELDVTFAPGGKIEFFVENANPNNVIGGVFLGANQA